MISAIITILDTARLNDALSCDHRAPIDYSEGGLRITFEAHPKLGPCVTLNGMDGEIRFIGFAELETVIAALQRAKAMTEQASALAIAAE